MLMQELEVLLGHKLEQLLSLKTCKVSKNLLSLPGPDFVDRIFAHSDRNIRVLQNFQAIFNHGRLSNTGYLSILPVDQGIEHSAGASFAPNPIYFDPENIIKLAIEGGCNAVATTFGNLAIMARKYAHKIPFLVKINHNQLLTYPNTYDQILFGKIQEAADLGARAVGATIYFGSPESNRQIVEVAKAFEEAHRLGMVTVLWCYLRNPSFKTKEADYHLAADLTAQANHLGCTIKADIIKQKLPTCNGGFKNLKFGVTSEKVYSDLCSNHPVDLARYQVLNCLSGRIPLINSGGPSGENDLVDAAETALINKLAGGAGLISGRKAFQKPLKSGVKLLHLIQDVYLSNDFKPIS